MWPNPENHAGEKVEEGRDLFYERTVQITEEVLFEQDEQALLEAIQSDLGITAQRYVEAENAYFGTSGATAEQAVEYHAFIVYSEMIRAEQSLNHQIDKRLPPLEHLNNATSHIPAVIDPRNKGLVEITVQDAIKEINSLTPQATPSMLTVKDVQWECLEQSGRLLHQTL